MSRLTNPGPVGTTGTAGPRNELTLVFFLPSQKKMTRDRTGTHSREALLAFAASAERPTDASV
jgi:hypothetical protein